MTSPKPRRRQKRPYSGCRGAGGKLLAPLTTYRYERPIASNFLLHLCSRIAFSRLEELNRTQNVRRHIVMLLFATAMIACENAPAQGPAQRSPTPRTIDDAVRVE